MSLVSEVFGLHSKLLIASAHGNWEAAAEANLTSPLRTPIILLYARSQTLYCKCALCSILMMFVTLARCHCLVSGALK